MNQEGTHSIEYAGPAQQRRPGRKIILIVVVGVSLWLCFTQLFQWALPRYNGWDRQRKHAAAERACLTYSASPDRVVYEERGDRPDRLLRADPQYREIGYPSKRAVGWLPAPWHLMDGSPQNGREAALIYLGRRTARDGREVFVAVTLQPFDGTDGARRLDLRIMTYSVIGGAVQWSAPQESNWSTRTITQWDPQGGTLAVYAGHDDVQDNSAIIARAEIAGEAFLLRVWVVHHGSAEPRQVEMRFTKDTQQIGAQAGRDAP